MHYKSEVEGVVRVPPRSFNDELTEAIEKQLKGDYEGRIFGDLGKVIAILNIAHIGEGVIIPGDGAAYYRVKFTILNYIQEINELVNGEIKDIAKFGAFVDFGPFEGMVHVSQTMDDYVSFSKTGALTGKQTKRTLKTGDKVRARIVAISMKDPRTPKIGLTMRQSYLGKAEWMEAESKKEIKKETKAAKKAAKEE